MMLDPQLALAAALALAAGWTMYFSGAKKRLLEPRRPRRTCPACGRIVTGRVCDAH